MENSFYAGLLTKIINDIGNDRKYTNFTKTLTVTITVLPLRIETGRENCTQVLSCTFSRVLEYSSTGDIVNLHK